METISFSPAAGNVERSRQQVLGSIAPLMGETAMAGDTFARLPVGNKQYLRLPFAGRQELDRNHMDMAREMLADRINLADILVREKQLAPEKLRMGALNAFEINPKNGVDAFRHIVAGGDRFGSGAARVPDIAGCHHLPTSRLMENRGLTDYIRVVEDKEVFANGVYSAKLSFIDRQGEQSFKRKQVSPFFPDFWSAQDVCDAVNYIRRQAPTGQSGEHFVHKGLFSRNPQEQPVRLMVITNKVRSEDGEGRVILNQKHQPKPTFVAVAAWPLTN